MPKIKPFIWNQIEEDIWRTETPFGCYVIGEFVNEGFKVQFHAIIGTFRTIELAKRFAFDDFKRRLEEILHEPVGYDLEIDLNC